MNKILAGLLILAWAAAEPVRAQERPLTIEEAVTIGLENSHALHASSMKSELADAQSGEVSAALYPSLKLQGGYTRLSSVPAFGVQTPFFNLSFPVVLNNYTAKATLQQPLFTGWKLQSAANSASYNADAASHDFARDRSVLVYNITAAYWNVYRAKETKRLTDESVAQFTEHLRDIRNMAAQGLATTNDVLKVEVQLSNAQLLQSDAENTLTVAMLSFNSTVGLPLTTVVSVASPLTPSTKEYPALDELLRRAYSSRSDLLASDLRIKAAESGVTAAKGGWSPQIFLTGDYIYARPNSRIFPLQDAFKDSWDVGISLQFDLWNNLTTVYQVSEASARLEQARDADAMQKDGVTLEVTQSYLSFLQAKKKIALARLGVDQANENDRVTKEKFKSGLTTNSELLDAEVAQLQAKLQLTQALVDYELAEARLETAIGGGEK